MKELRAQEASTPGFKDAFLETTEPARQLVDSVFGRLQWTSEPFKVIKITLYCTVPHQDSHPRKNLLIIT